MDARILSSTAFEDWWSKGGQLSSGKIWSARTPEGLARVAFMAGYENAAEEGLTFEQVSEARQADMVMIGRLDEALTACTSMLAFLRQRDGECLGDHPAWLRRIDGIFTAHAAVIATPVPVRNGDDGQSVLGGEAEAKTGGATPPTGYPPFDTVGPFQRGHIANPERDMGGDEYADVRDFTEPYEP